MHYKDYFKKDAELKKILLKEQNMLVNNVFLIEKNIAYTRKRKPYKKMILEHSFKKDSLFKSLSKTILRNFLNLGRKKINSSGKNFEGELLLLTRNKIIKIFDIKNSIILSKFPNEESFSRYLDSRNKISNIFNVIKLINFDASHNLIEEEFVRHKPYLYWKEHETENIINKIFITYIKYYTSKLHSKSVYSINEYLINNTDSTELSRLKKELRLKNISEDLLVSTPCHGDICFKNILYKDKNNIYFIDWEHHGDYLFFYDLINWMFVEALDRDDYLYLDKFINGEYDQQFMKVFKSLDIKFESCLKLSYLKLYIIQRFNKRDKPKLLDEQKVMVDRYIDIYNKLIDKGEQLNGT